MGRGRLDYNGTTSKTMTMSALVTKEWGQVIDLNSPPPDASVELASPDSPHPQAGSVGLCGPKTSRTDSKEPTLLQGTSGSLSTLRSVRNDFALEFIFLLKLMLLTKNRVTVSSMDTAVGHLCKSRCMGATAVYSHAAKCLLWLVTNQLPAPLCPDGSAG